MRWLDLTVRQMISWCKKPCRCYGFDCHGEKSVECPLQFPWYIKPFERCVFLNFDELHWNESEILNSDCTYMGFELKQAGRLLIDLPLELHRQAVIIGRSPQLWYNPRAWHYSTRNKYSSLTPDKTDKPSRLLKEPTRGFRRLHPEIYREEMEL